MSVQERLFALKDEDFARFQSALIPNIPKETVVGVRMPMIRKLAKEIAGEAETQAFLTELPHAYYDENMLHSVLLSRMKDYGACMEAVEAFLPYVDNWAVCDCLSPKVFAKHKPELMEKIRKWVKAEHVYTCRFGLEMLMTHFLDADFQAGVPRSGGRCAAGGLLREDDGRVVFCHGAGQAVGRGSRVSGNPYRLEPWTHNKTIQKARESYRISTEQKAYLRTLKR